MHGRDLDCSFHRHSKSCVDLESCVSNDRHTFVIKLYLLFGSSQTVDRSTWEFAQVQLRDASHGQSR